MLHIILSILYTEEVTALNRYLIIPVYLQFVLAVPAIDTLVTSSHKLQQRKVSVIWSPS